MPFIECLRRIIISLFRRHHCHQDLLITWDITNMYRHQRTNVRTHNDNNMSRRHLHRRHIIHTRHHSIRQQPFLISSGLIILLNNNNNNKSDRRLLRFMEGHK
jgi:hypothetical protein